MASKLGDFFVELGAMPNLTGIDKFGNGLKSIGKTALGVGATIAGLTAGFVMMVNNTSKETAELGRMSNILGISVGQLDEFQKIFQLAGGDAQNATAMISDLQKTVAGFQFGEYDKELGVKLRLAPQDFTNNFMQNIELIRNRLQLLYPDKKQWEYALNSVGIGSDAIKILGLSTKEYNRLKREADATGLATKNQVKSSQDYYENIVKLRLEFQTFKRELMEMTAPQFGDFVKEMVTLFKDKDFKKGVADFVNTLTSALPPLIEMLKELMPLITPLVKLAEIVIKPIDWILNPEETRDIVSKSKMANTKIDSDTFKNTFKYLFASTEEDRAGMSLSEYINSKRNLDDIKRIEKENNRHQSNMLYYKKNSGINTSSQNISNNNTSNNNNIVINVKSTNPKESANEISNAIKKANQDIKKAGV